MMKPMAESATPSSERLLSIIELQNAIAAAALTADEVMRVVADRAHQLLNATSTTVELVEGDDLVTRATSGTGSSQQLGVRRSQKAGLSGACIQGRKPVHDDTNVCVPLLHGEYAVGCLCASGPKGGKFGDEDVETLRL